MADIISIIIPVYNASKYLHRCLESVVSQTYRHLEIIVVDDGSTDGSAQICEAYERQDDRILVIRQENGGCIAARKTGLRSAGGTYIGFVDADDSIEPEMFEKLYGAMKEHGADLVHSGMIIDGEKKCADRGEIVDFTVTDRAAYLCRNLFDTQTMPFPLWSKLFLAPLVREAYMKLPDEQSYGEDLLCLCNCLLQCSRLYIYPDAFYHYRVQQGSLSHLQWPDACLEEARLHEHVRGIFRQNNLPAVCDVSAKQHYKRRLLQVMMEDGNNGIVALRYYYGNADSLRNKKIVIYGAGNVGKDFYCQFSRSCTCKIAAWTDREKYGVWNLIPIVKPEALQHITYDVIVLAVKTKELADQIREELTGSVCPDGAKILWEAPVCNW